MKRVVVALATAALSLGLVVTNASGGVGVSSASSFSDAVAQVASGRLGYRVSNPAAYVRAKALAAARAGQHPGGAQGIGPKGTVDVQWDGIFDNSVSPPDPTGAIGPNSYIELINEMYAIYNRSGSPISSGALSQLTGTSTIGDPQVLWDTNDQRFYYADIAGNLTTSWGFSKNNNPQSAADFCKYNANFGYGGALADYPKLGNSPHFLMMGVNIFGNGTTSDVDWISKGSVGPNPISTCPPQSQFQIGKFSNIRNADGSQMATPNPAQNTEPGLPTRAEGWIVGAKDVSNGSSSNFLTVYGVFATAIGPKLSGPFTLPVPSYNMPPDAPECSSSKLLSTLDGRLEHAVASFDPLNGVNDAIWTAHAVAGGAGSEERWYEINPLTNPPTLIQSGKATDSSLYVWNGAISSDRVVNSTGKAFGSDMSMGFSTSSSTACPAVQDVSKVGNNAQSAFVMVKQSAGPDGDFTCSPVCRWGDYSGATPDPAADLGGTEGNVWHSNMWIASLNTRTENWEITP
jgi:hypothetical protein